MRSGTIEERLHQLRRDAEEEEPDRRALVVKAVSAAVDLYAKDYGPDYYSNRSWCGVLDEIRDQLWDDTEEDGADANTTEQESSVSRRAPLNDRVRSMFGVVILVLALAVSISFTNFVGQRNIVKKVRQAADTTVVTTRHLQVVNSDGEPLVMLSSIHPELEKDGNFARVWMRVEGVQEGVTSPLMIGTKDNAVMVHAVAAAIENSLQGDTNDDTEN